MQGSNRAADVMHPVDIVVAVPGNDTDAMVAAMSTGLGQLADTIADKLATR
jgi:uncharacterized lipoprotein YmbA